MQKLSRRKFLKDTSTVAGFPMIAGLPLLFPATALANGDPPKTTSKKVVSPSKPPTKKPPTNKPPTKKPSPPPPPPPPPPHKPPPPPTHK